MPVEIEGLKEAVKAIESRYGKGTIRRGSETQSVLRIPTGSLELDYATGGGIPIGRISRVFGAYSSSKTMNCLKIAKNAHNLADFGEQFVQSNYGPLKDIGKEILNKFPQGMEVAYYNIEKAEDKDFAKKLGVDIDRLHVVDNVSTIEGVGEILEGLLSSVHVHIIDSASSAVSVDELNSEVGDWHMGLNARAWGKVFRRIGERLDHHDNVIIVIDQVRNDLRTGAEGPPGGRAMEHASSMTIHFKRGPWLHMKNGELQKTGTSSPNSLSGSLEADGIEIQARVIKSRVGRPLKTARLQLDLEKLDFDDLEEYAKAAIYFKLVKQTGAWYELPDGNKIQGKAKIKELIKEDSGFKQQIFEAVYKNILEQKVIKDSD